MAVATVQTIAFDQSRTAEIGPALLDYGARESGLKQLGPSLMTFAEESSTDWWTLKYEEVVFVAEGKAVITVRGTDSVVVAEPGQAITIPRDATVRYGGTAGSRLFLAITPVNWRELEETES
ncbi:hypothetical protein [Saccharopolyspora mangrovi]|uniref:Cupin domain-containing protein n=1 Tax=Saccharopolyspora mangrovi TaxID=3082379 RepID=A0ABU6AG51_9PSEU|nr:hypothetical protein [Saccharopolyspora sp. S2-29]MEB3370527.1 hypothetical protein [Saccharopolyspora sp. S2-29]